MYLDIILINLHFQRLGQSFRDHLSLRDNITALFVLQSVFMMSRTTSTGRVLFLKKYCNENSVIVIDLYGV
jgi:hypothetical protein